MPIPPDQTLTRHQAAGLLWRALLRLLAPKTARSPLLLLTLAVAANGPSPSYSGEMLTGASMIAAGVAASQSTHSSHAVPVEARAVVDFWREAGPTLWFAKDVDFDSRFRERFLSAYEAARRGELVHWLKTLDGALALVILLDQFPRNAFRGTPRMYATDDVARQAANAAIAAGHDRAVDAALALFFYLPFGHSEDLADQERSVELARRLGQPTLSHAEGHSDIVRRFGRFPHRNPILGRTMPEEEQRYLDGGGFAG